MNETKQFIKTIESLHNSVIQVLNQAIKKYQIISGSIESVDLKEVENILTTEIKVKDFTLQSLFDEIKSAYPRDLISFDLDAEKLKSRKKKQFLRTHNGGFLCLAISDDAKILLTGLADATLRVWDLTEKKQIACYDEHKNEVLCVTISSDSTLAVSGSEDKSLILWDLRRHCVKHVFRGHSGAVFSVALSLDTNLMISSCYKKEIIFWSMQSFASLRKIQTQYVVCSLFVSSNNELYSATGWFLEKWNIISFKKSKSIDAHFQKINSITKTKNNKFLITGSDDYTVRLWNMSTLKNKGTLSGHSDAVRSVCVSEDDTKILSAGEDNTIIVWSIDTLSQIHKFSYHNDFILGVNCYNDMIYSVSRDARIGIAKLSSKSFKSYLCLKPFTVKAIHQMGNFIAYGCLETVALWGLNESEILLEGHCNLVQAVCFSPNMRKLMSSSKGNKKNLIVWDLQQRCVLSILNGHRDSVFCIDISADGSNAISGDADNLVLYWDLDKTKEICKFEGHTCFVESVKFTKSKMYAASGGTDRTVIVWDLMNKVRYAVFNGHQDYVWKVSITSDDEQVVSGDLSDGIRVWSIKLKQEIFRFKNLEEAKEWLSVNKEMRSEFSKFIV